jgi:hypothetical protein
MLLTAVRRLPAPASHRVRSRVPAEHRQLCGGARRARSIEAPMAPNAKFTEQTKELNVGEGL